MWTDFELNTVTDMNGTSSVPIIFGVRSKRVSKGSYGISGKVTITDTFEGYDVRDGTLMDDKILMCLFFIGGGESLAQFERRK